MGIGGDEASQVRVVYTALHVDEVNTHQMAMAGKTPIGQAVGDDDRLTGLRVLDGHAPFAEGIVMEFLDDIAVFIGDGGDGVEVVTMEVVGFG